MCLPDTFETQPDWMYTASLALSGRLDRLESVEKITVSDYVSTMDCLTPGEACGNLRLTFSLPLLGVIR